MCGSTDFVIWYVFNSWFTEPNTCLFDSVYNNSFYSLISLRYCIHKASSFGCLVLSCSNVHISLP